MDSIRRPAQSMRLSWHLSRYGMVERHCGRLPFPDEVGWAAVNS
jgi:hypothetical protein